MSDFWTWLMSTIPPAADPDPFAMTTGQTIACVWICAAMAVAFVQWHWIRDLEFDVTEGAKREAKLEQRLLDCGCVAEDQT